MARNINDNRLEQVIATYLDEVAEGMAVDRQAILDDHPDLAEELHSFFQLNDRLREATCQAEHASITDADPGNTIAGMADTVVSDRTRAHYVAGRRFGDYLLIDEIGRGGMGIVYKAQQLSLDRVVALKILRSERLACDDEVKRFLAEPKAAARLDHAGIAPIHDVGTVDGTPYYSMGFVEGESLADRLNAGPLEPRHAAELMVKIAEAVQLAHDNHVLHRDLKPSNILLDRSGAPRIVDFGLAKSNIAGDLTATGEILGTPAYMSPEQAAADTVGVGPPSDLYSLGATLYAMLTGSPPFQSAHVYDTLAQVRNRLPVALRELNPLVPRDLETICLKCLEKSPHRRYASVSEFADDLRRHLEGQPIVARPVGQVERYIRWVHRNPVVAGWSLATVGILVLATVCLSFLVMWLNDARRDAKQNEQLAKTAEKRRTDQLWSALVEQARARRWSARDGQRFTSLDALGKAAALRPTRQLRNEAIACMALPDLQPGPEWPIFADQPTERTGGLVVDEAYQRIAQSDPQGNVTIKNIGDDTQIACLPTGGAVSWFMRFSPDGRYLAARYSSAAFIVWDIATQQQVLRITELTGEFAACFAPDGQWIAIGAHDDSVSVYRLPDGERIRKITGVPRPFWIAVDATGSRLASTSYAHDITIVDIEAGEVRKMIGASTRIRVVAWHPCRNLIAAGGKDGQIHLFDSSTGKRVGVLTGHKSVVVELCFSRGDGRYLASHSWDNSLRLWDHETEQQVVALHPVAAVGWFPMLHFSPDNRFVAYSLSSRNMTIRLVEASLAEECIPLYAKKGRAGSAHGLAFDPASEMLATGTNDLSVWQVGTAKRLAWVDSLCSGWLNWLPDGSGIIASSNDGSSRLLGKWPITHLEEAADRLKLRLGTLHQLWSGHTVNQHVISGDGRLLAVVDHGRIVLFDVANDASRLQPLNEFPLDETTRAKGGFTVAVSPDKKFVAGAGWQSPAVSVWDIESGNQVTSIPVHFANAIYVGFSPDGKWFVTGDGQYFRFHDVRTWQPVRQLAREAGNAVLAFSPDGRTIAASHSSYVVRLLDASNLSELARLEPRSGGMISSLAFSPNGAYLAVGTENRVTNVWNLQRLRQGLRNIGLDWHLPPLDAVAGGSARTIAVDAGGANPRSRSEKQPFWTSANPSPEQSLLALARKLCHEERWDDALSLLQAVVSPEQFATDSGVYRTAVFYQPPLLVRAGQMEGYHDFCQRLLERFGTSDNTALLEQTAKAALFVPPTPENLRLACQVAERSYELERHRWSALAMAFAGFRAGKQQQARQFCGEVIKADQEWYLRAEARLILSIVDARVKDVRAAENALAEAKEILANVAGRYEQGLERDGYQDWLICKMLINEAEASLAESTAAQP